MIKDNGLGMSEDELIEAMRPATKILMTTDLPTNWVDLAGDLNQLPFPSVKF